jgi:hypothetical protein
MFVNLNKTTMPIFYGKVALIESLKSIKTPNSTIGFCTYDGCVTSRASFINAAIIGWE